MPTSIHHPSIHPTLSTLCITFPTSVYLSNIYLTIHLSVCLSVYLPIYLFIVSVYLHPSIIKSLETKFSVSTRKFSLSVSSWTLKLLLRRYTLTHNSIGHQACTHVDILSNVQQQQQQQRENPSTRFTSSDSCQVEVFFSFYEGEFDTQ